LENVSLQAKHIGKLHRFLIKLRVIQNLVTQQADRQGDRRQRHL